MVTTCSVKTAFVNQDDLPHSTYPDERREIRGGSRGIDVDARIISMLRRKVSLSSHGEGFVDSCRRGEDPMSRDAAIASSFRSTGNCFDKDPDYVGKGVIQNARSRCMKLRCMDEQFAPADIKKNEHQLERKTREIPSFNREQSPYLSSRIHPAGFRGTAHAVSAPFKGSRLPGLAYAVAPESSFPTSLALSSDGQFSTVNSSARVVHLNCETSRDMSEARDVLSGVYSCSGTLDMKTSIDNVMRRTTDISQLMQDTYEIDTGKRQSLPTTTIASRLPPKQDGLRLEPLQVYDQPVSLDYVSQSMSNHAGLPPPHWSPHCDRATYHHDSARRSVPSTTNQFEFDRSMERPRYSRASHGKYHPARFHQQLEYALRTAGEAYSNDDCSHYGTGCEQIGFNDHHVYGNLDINHNKIVEEGYGHVAVSSPIDLWRPTAVSESFPGSLSTPALRETQNETGEHTRSGGYLDVPSHEDNSGRCIKNERATAILPSLEQVLDYVDEIASPILPGMDILSFQRHRENLDVDDPLRCEIDQDGCRQHVALMFPGNVPALAALPRLDPVATLRNPAERDALSSLMRHDIPSALEHRILQNANREWAYEKDVVSALRDSAGVLSLPVDHSNQGAPPPHGINRQDSCVHNDEGKSGLPLPHLEDMNMNRDCSSSRKHTRKPILPHLEEVTKDQDGSGWRDDIGKPTPPIPHLEEISQYHRPTNPLKVKKSTMTC